MLRDTVRHTLSRSALLLVLVAGGAPAADTAPKLLGKHKDWAAYVLEDGGGRICYIASAPLESTPEMPDRAPVWVTVTHRPGSEVTNEVGVLAGYQYQPGTEVNAIVDTRSYELFTQGDGAWLRTPEEEVEMVGDMKKGRRMSVVGVSASGVTTTDKYSLLGFTAAHRAITEACS